MELKKVQQHWNEFPEMSMEERPVLSTDLETVIVSNPLTGNYYLKNKLIVKIVIGVILLLFNIPQSFAAISTSGNEMYEQGGLFLLLAVFIFYHSYLLWFAGYPTLLSLPLLSFLKKIESTLEKYIFSFKLTSAIMGFYLLAGIRKLLGLCGSPLYESIQQNGFYRWLIIIFLSVSFYILTLHTVILKYKKLLTVFSDYRKEIELHAQKN